MNLFSASMDFSIGLDHFLYIYFYILVLFVCHLAISLCWDGGIWLGGKKKKKKKEKSMLNPFPVPLLLLMHIDQWNTYRGL